MSQPQQHQTIIINGPAPSQALPALVNFFCFPGLGQLIQGRILAALVWWLLHGIAAASCLILIGFVLWPIVWIACVIDAARYNPMEHQGESASTAALVGVGVIGVLVLIPVFLFCGMMVIGSFASSDRPVSASHNESPPPIQLPAEQPSIVTEAPSSTPVTSLPQAEQSTQDLPSGFVRFPDPIRLGDVELIPVSARIGKVELKSFAGTSSSKDDKNFELTLRIKNHSEVKRLEFRGWPEKHSILRNFTVEDEHGNKYRWLDFGAGTRSAQDSAGEYIDPGMEAIAVILFEPPIAAATTLRIDLDGKAVGSTERVKILIGRDDWTPKADATIAVSPPDASPSTVTPPMPSPPPVSLEGAIIGGDRQAAESREVARQKKIEDAKWRTWHASSGGFSVEAKFVRFGAGKVTLEKRDGKVITVDIEILAADDAAFIREQRWLKAGDE